MWPSLQFPVDFLMFTEEIFNVKLHFWYSVSIKVIYKEFLPLLDNKGFRVFQSSLFLVIFFKSKLLQYFLLSFL